MLTTLGIRYVRGVQIVKVTLHKPAILKAITNKFVDTLICVESAFSTLPCLYSWVFLDFPWQY